MLTNTCVRDFFFFLPVLQCTDDPSSRFVLASHQHVLHLHLGDGRQQKGHTNAEQSQLRRQKSTRGRLLLLAVQELEPPLELHRLQGGGKKVQVVELLTVRKIQRYLRSKLARKTKKNPALTSSEFNSDSMKSCKSFFFLSHDNPLCNKKAIFKFWSSRRETKS